MRSRESKFWVVPHQLFYKTASVQMVLGYLFPTMLYRDLVFSRTVVVIR
jgi:hypothetical protein